MDRHTMQLISAFGRFQEKICVLKNQNRNLQEPEDGWYAAYARDQNIRMPDWTLAPDGQTGYTAWIYDGMVIIKVPVADAAFIQEDRLREQANCHYNKYTISDCGRFVFYSFHIPNPEMD